MTAKYHIIEQEVRVVPNIKPISDLRNYTEVLNEVAENSPVYLTRNGRGEYAIMTIDDLDRLKATIRLLAFLGEGERSGKEEGWLSAEEVEASLGI